MHDLTELLLAQTRSDDRHDADPDLLAGLLASLLRAEAARNGATFCNVALFALTLRGTYAAHPPPVVRATGKRNAVQINRNLYHLAREYAAACGLPDDRLDDALAFSARIWEVLHPPR